MVSDAIAAERKAHRPALMNAPIETTTPGAGSVQRLVRRRCPACGGEGGMEYHATMFTLRHYDWDGEDFEVEVERSKFPLGGKCIDCGKWFSFRALDTALHSKPPNDKVSDERA